MQVPVEALRSADPDLRSLINVNTPDDLLDARDSTGAPSRVSRGAAVKLEVIEVASRRSTARDAERAPRSPSS